MFSTLWKLSRQILTSYPKFDKLKQIYKDEIHNRISKIKVANCVQHITRFEQKRRKNFGICEVIIVRKWKTGKYLFRNFLFNISSISNSSRLSAA